MGAWTKAISAFQVHPLPKTPCEPRTKKTLTFYHTGCLIGVPKILKMLLLESPHNWVGVHPLYTLNNHLGLFFIAHVTMHTSPPKKKKKTGSPRPYRRWRLRTQQLHADNRLQCNPPERPWTSYWRMASDGNTRRKINSWNHPCIIYIYTYMDGWIFNGFHVGEIYHTWMVWF